VFGRELGKNSLDISFSRSEHGLPSRACDDARRRDYYNKQYVGDGKQPLLYILRQLGALEEKKQEV
jgi:hypothetical protein